MYLYEFLSIQPVHVYLKYTIYVTAENYGTSCTVSKTGSFIHDCDAEH